MATKPGIWLKPGAAAPGYQELQQGLTTVISRLTALEATVTGLVNAPGSDPIVLPTIPSNLTELLARVLPSGGLPGQVASRTLSGYVWIDLPTVTTPTDPTTPTQPDDYSASVTALDSASSDMSTKTAALT